MDRIRTEVSRKAWAAFKLYTAACMDSASVAARVGISIDDVYEANSIIVKRLKAVLDEQACDEG
jgi:hypothetical protein